MNGRRQKIAVSCCFCGESLGDESATVLVLTKDQMWWSHADCFYLRLNVEGRSTAFPYRFEEVG